MLIAVLNKKITLGKMLRNWGVVYIGNLIGSVMLLSSWSCQSNTHLLAARLERLHLP
jgi:formate/nitrite transporter FocA (FNT family)